MTGLAAHTVGKTEAAAACCRWIRMATQAFLRVLRRTKAQALAVMCCARGRVRTCHAWLCAPAAELLSCQVIISFCRTVLPLATSLL